MEKIIAFKAFNGRLFETKEKCEKYESKMKKYPITKIVRTQQKKPYYYENEIADNEEIYLVEETTWTSPTYKKTKKYVELKTDKFTYKLTYNSGEHGRKYYHIADLMSGYKKSITLFLRVLKQELFSDNFDNLTKEYLNQRFTEKLYSENLGLNLHDMYSLSFERIDNVLKIRLSNCYNGMNLTIEKVENK